MDCRGMKNVIAVIALLLQVNLSVGQEHFLLEGKIKSLTNVKVSLKDLNGKVLWQSMILKQAQDFSFGPVNIVPDLYELSIGKTNQKIFLANNKVTISGYYDNVDPQNSNLEFTGLQSHFAMMAFMPKRLKDRVDSNAFTQLNGRQLSALSYLVKLDNYEYSKAFIDKIPATDLKSLSAQKLLRKADSLKQFRAGIEAPGFNLPDEKGKLISLAKFRGRIVVLDFWAGWCLPCRREMEVFKTFYKDYEDKVQFISISLDEDPAKYKMALQEMNIPWLKLWDKSGFGKSALQTQYGFKAIPFCVVVDANGKVFRRNIINGIELKKALDAITKKEI